MFNKFITSPNDLVTTHEQTRAGFLSIALEKNMVGDPYVKRALAFKTMVSETTCPDDFLDMPAVRPFVLTASGLSDKAMNYLDEDDKTLAIKELIDNFLKPAGENYIDETIYRYLLVKGDAMGGTMRNRIGALGQEKRFESIRSTIDSNKAFNEILCALRKRKDNGDLNNNGIIRMVEGYYRISLYICWAIPSM